VSRTALLVGGGHFVGRRLLESLVQAGYQLDVLNRGLTLPADHLPPGVRHRAADRTDAAAVRAAVGGRRYDVVFDTSGYRPQEVQAVLDAVDAGRYVYVSTLMVYAWLSAPVADDAPPQPLAEDAELVAPYWGDGDLGEFYPGYKRACELRLLDQDRIPATVVRPCGIYGAGDDWYRHDYFFDRVVRGRPVLLPDSHASRRVHLTSVDGLTEVCRFAAVDPSAGHRVFNVADDDSATYLELAAMCAEVARVEPDIQPYDPRPVAQLVAAAPARARFPFGAEPGFVLDGGRVRHELGWSGATLRDGTARLYRDFADRYVKGDTAEPDFSLDDALLGAPPGRAG
jgi:nucleoside-diphosphate-sugar epimerase